MIENYGHTNYLPKSSKDCEDIEMNDNELMKRIEFLVKEEHELIQKEEDGNLQGDEHQRMQELQVNLDQCWDLLRQRRARRNAGLNPDQATVRDPNTVEHYLQ